MTALDVRYRWTPEAFLRAEAAGVFDGQVELVDGEVWPVAIGDWHGPATIRCGYLLHAAGVLVTQQTLPTGDSLPDPDVWVRPASARPVGSVSRRISRRISRWDPVDVLLVVEVSDETVAVDLSVKARLYAAGGYPTYWVVTREAVHEHRDPGPGGYATVTRYERGDAVPVRHTGSTLRVAELLGDEPA